MKAVSFLEWQRDYLTNTRFNVFNVHVERIQRVINFYSQPFKPEMITELFEGWVEFPNRLFETEIRYTKWFVSDTLRKTISVTYFKFPALKKEIPFEYVSYRINRQIDFPISLDTFINDCKNIIDLTWKPEIEKEYFS